MSYLQKLQDELAAIKPEGFIEPRSEINPKTDHVVGKASDEAQRLYTLMQNRRKQGFDASIELAIKGIGMLGTRPNDKFDQLTQFENDVAGIAQRREDLELIKKIFFATLLDQFPEELKEKTCIGISRGFQVFWQEPDDSEPDDTGEIVARIIAIEPVWHKRGHKKHQRRPRSRTRKRKQTA